MSQKNNVCVCVCVWGVGGGGCVCVCVCVCTLLLLSIFLVFERFLGPCRCFIVNSIECKYILCK